MSCCCCCSCCKCCNCKCPERDSKKDEDRVFNFILGLRQSYKDKLNDSLSMDRGDLGRWACCFTCCDKMTDQVDDTLKTLLPCLPYTACCSAIFDSMCLALVKTQAIYEELSSASVDFRIFPSNKSIVKLMQKTYYADIYGFNKHNISRI
jgi:hypothetical protein